MSDTPDLLSVDDVLVRYGLRDRRAARRVMDEAGAFLVAGRLLIREPDLVAWEDREKAARAAANEGPPLRGAAVAARRPKSPRTRTEPLPAEWWNNPSQT